MNSNINLFDIAPDVLTPAREKGKWECPICNNPNLSIGRNGYKCFSGCDSKEVYEEAVRRTGKWQERKEKSEPQPIINGVGLTEAHYIEFEKSGISRAIAKLNFAGVDDPATIAHFLCRKYWKGGPGWIARSLDIKGNLTDIGQFKPNTIYKPFPTSKPRKYLGKDGEGNYDALLMNHPDFNWGDIEKDDSVIVITEGAKKALKTMDHDFLAKDDEPSRFPCIAIPGVTTWGKEKGKKLVPNLELFVKPGRKFVIAFDADYKSKHSVKYELKKLGEKLTERECDVEVWDWDIKIDGVEYKGIDDLLVAKLDHKIRKIPFSQWLLGEQKKEKKEVADRVRKDIEKHPEESDVAIALEDDYRSRLFYEKDSKNWYWYKDGIWHDEDDTFIGSEAVIPYLKSNEYKYKLSFINGIVGQLKLLLRTDSKKIKGRKGIIPFKNGVLNLSTMILESHSPSNYLFWCLPYNYNPLATCEPIQDWLRTVVDHEDQVQYLRAFLACVVRGRADLQKFLEIQGPGGTGKSTFMNIASALVGNDNVHTTSLFKLEGNNFEMARIHNKRLVNIADSDAYGGSVSNLKQLTGGDGVQGEVKYLQKQIDINFRGMVLISCNQPIQSNDYTSGITRRRSVILFKNVVPDEKKGDPLLEKTEDNELSGQFLPYIPGLMNWVLEMPDSEVTNYFRFTSKYVPSLTEISYEAIAKTNPLAQWVDSYLILDKDKENQIGDARENKDRDIQKAYLHTYEWLYPSYCEYCVTNGHKPLSGVKFGDNLEDLLKNTFKLSFISRYKNSKGRFLRGVILRPDSDYETPLFFSVAPDQPISQLMATRNNDGLMMGSDGLVTAEPFTSDGYDGYDGLNEKVSRKKINSEEEKTNEKEKVFDSTHHTRHYSVIEPIPDVTQPVTEPVINTDTGPVGDVGNEKTSNSGDLTKPSEPSTQHYPVTASTPTGTDANTTQVLTIGMSYGQYTPLKESSQFLGQVELVKTSYGPYEFSHEAKGEAGLVRVYFNRTKNRQLWIDVSNPGHCEKPYPLD